MTRFQLDPLLQVAERLILGGADINHPSVRYEIETVEKRIGKARSTLDGNEAKAEAEDASTRLPESLIIANGVYDDREIKEMQRRLDIILPRLLEWGYRPC